MVHTEGGRRRGKPRSRILYWFRTPPGVRVGRSALDEDAIRLIEEHNPDVEFDWTRILKGQDALPSFTPIQPERRARPRPPRDPVPQRTQTAPPVEPVTAVEPAQVVEAEPHEAEDAREEERIATPETPPSTIAEARLGAEGLARLRARHAEVLARISEATPDPARREELKSQADRLNPDTWVTDGEVTAGLESYEVVFESLRTVVGRRRKRRRSQRPRQEQAASSAPADDPDDDETEPGVG